jgi:hypothetical protein
MLPCLQEYSGVFNADDTHFIVLSENSPVASRTAMHSYAYYLRGIGLQLEAIEWRSMLDTFLSFVMLKQFDHMLEPLAQTECLDMAFRNSRRAAHAVQHSRWQERLHIVAQNMVIDVARDRSPQSLGFHSATCSRAISY